MVEVQNSNEYKIGDKVWWFDAWGTLRWGIIYRFDGLYACIHEEGEKGIETGAKLIECWPTKAACLDAEKQRSELQKAEYVKEITDVNALILFLFNHDMRSENRDCDAAYAARVRAKELLGIEIPK